MTPIRRHPDGSIDFDSYRAEARSLRRQAMRDAGSLPRVGRLYAGAMVALALCVMTLFALGSRPERNIAAAGAPAANHAIR